MKTNTKKNYIFCGDNLEWLNNVPDESVDLCYIDPPFFSNRTYEVIWGNGYELRAFGDRFAGGISHYIEWMRPRVELIHRKIKKTGSIFLHCDHHASHRLRCLLDEVFGEKNFVNELVWSYKTGGASKNFFARKHDTIYFYSKSANYNFYAQKERSYMMHKYGFKKSDFKIDPDNGLQYTMVYARDVMEIPSIGSASGERLGYPTQKPEALIKRLLDSTTKEGDVVLDCFGGGGTTAKVCADNNRFFITGDVSPVAVKLMAERLLFDSPSVQFEIKNLPKTERELKKMNGHVFADTVCDVMGWEINEKKSGDGGIDAWAADGSPVQIKNHSTASAGRPDMQRFFGALGREKKGIFVAWGFSRDALEYIATIKSEKKIEIIPMKCSEVFGGLLLDHSKGEEIEKLYLERRPSSWVKDLAAKEANASEQKRVLEKAKMAKEKTKKGRTRDISNR